MSRGRMANCISTTDSCMRSGFGRLHEYFSAWSRQHIAACGRDSVQSSPSRRCASSGRPTRTHIAIRSTASSVRRVSAACRSRTARAVSPSERRIRTRHRFRPARIAANARWPAASAFQPRGRSGRARSRSSRIRPRAAANEGTVRRNETISCAGSARTTTSSALNDAVGFELRDSGFDLPQAARLLH